MKKTILALVLISSMPVTAQVSELCREINEVSKTIMNKRQSGVSMIEMLDIAKDNEIVKKIIMDAYDTPMYSVESNKQREVTKFANQWLSACIKSEV